MRDTILIILIFALCFGLLIYKCSHNEDLINYGNDDYYFVGVQVDCGRSGLSYYGTITKTDYDKWLNGESGTVFIHSAKMDNYGWRVNTYSIASISNHGSTPDWLPLNFRYR